MAEDETTVCLAEAGADGRGQNKRVQRLELMAEDRTSMCLAAA